ncbi:unnamed protein product [Enterobius vermicularis]|uniref:ABC transmembrane type-1 domain-containing protein n=1 Tax=Enterobius vermicularis TaxID=51028 RepID=A0A0N4VGN8_ENTVE|nr:unnamed protein product [Enterobius vermicularis]
MDEFSHEGDSQMVSSQLAAHRNAIIALLSAQIFGSLVMTGLTISSVSPVLIASVLSLIYTWKQFRTTSEYLLLKTRRNWLSSKSRVRLFY